MSDSNGSSSSGVSLLKGILPIKRGTAIRDVLAGISLAFMDIPQVLGYARIAGMPAVTGLYTVFLPLVAFAIFGASRHLVVAADSATATIFASRVSAMAPLGSTEYVTLAAMVALLTAAMLLLARIFRLGFLADFLSRTVLVGFLAGVGVQLSIAMLGDMLGMAVPAPSSRSVAQLEYVVTHLARTHLPTLALAALVVGAILGCKRVLPRVPMPMIAVAGSIAASRAFDFSAHGVAVLGPVAGGLPALRIPAVTWQQLLDLVPVAASCFVMIIAQSAAAARVFAQQYREAVDTDADILGLAAANAAAAFSGTFVVNGSPTQTAMADGAGTRSQVGQLAFAAVVVVVLLFLSPLLQYLPHGVLAAIVFTIALGLINVQSLRAIRRESPGEFTLALVTAAAVVMIGVEQGILLAVALSLMRHVRHSYRPHTMVLEPAAGDGRWLPVPARPGAMTAPGLIVYRFGSDLFYANDHQFAEEVAALVDAAPVAPRWFIIDAGAITDVDYSAARTVSDLVRSLRARGIGVIFGRVNRYLRADMERHGIAAIVGASCIFATLHEALAAAGVQPEAHEPGGL
ncbi:SulP family inorganic anion transporter [Burkholderia ubonensis]|uniref:SulP family inorganic anion transporter n=1 Tax=Burkholderia ubonensis TaxID=101571 RepID=A0AB74DEW1_9BURK|nr:SulP family inorganic anion transporter [Burkholderia ubonensis]PAJ77484.1 sodium-independent anion transporter [Burkholderia ubonensis]PAJ86929.1 sodium-independent anion transporter [Burkholderia ubonensis]PAJ93820.1 sodium-independent anion transporter [Burkholderia ubonensis]PAJ97533.1 sodium-independent anion transporter [Burkholderia ubonensis]PAK07887.1 sodium-independent anion transporter [Burkholderia ubonensis]